jgi:hypothetical protein
MVTPLFLTLLSVGILGTMTGRYIASYPYYGGAYSVAEEPFYTVRRSWKGHRYWYGSRYKHGDRHRHNHRHDFHGQRHHQRGFSHWRQ